MTVFESDTVKVDTTGASVPLPSYDMSTRAPWIEAMARNLGSAYFGTPTQAGMMSRPIPIPMQQIAGLSPMEIQARKLILMKRVHTWIREQEIYFKQVMDNLVVVLMILP
jgi:hypothetical protein